MPESSLNRKKITILTPVYNEQDSLPVFAREVTEKLLRRTDYDFEVLLIDDGSSDRSWELIGEIASRDPRFRGVRLSRNYGAHTALSAGFAHADGDAVATLACDLQDPPEVVLEFLQKWEDGARIVWGRRQSREDASWRVLASGVFYRLIRRFAMPAGSKFTTGSFFLADRQVVDCFRQFQEHNRITFALVAWTGFEQEVVDYVRRRREQGTSGWNYRKMLKAMYDTFIGFSLLPIRLITLLGVIVFLLTVVLSSYLIITWLCGGVLPGWTSIMLGLALFFGVQFLLMGLTGEYLYRIYAEVVRRPLYFISDQTTRLTSAGGGCA